MSIGTWKYENFLSVTRERIGDGLVSRQVVTRDVVTLAREPAGFSNASTANAAMSATATCASLRPARRAASR